MNGYRVDPAELGGLAGLLGQAADVATSAASGLVSGAGGDLGTPALNAAASRFSRACRDSIESAAEFVHGLAGGVDDVRGAYLRTEDSAESVFRDSGIGAVLAGDVR